MGKEQKESHGHRLSSSLKVGAIAFSFLVVGFQAAVFIREAAVESIVSHRDEPDTVYVVDEELARRLLSEMQPADASPGEVHGATGDFQVAGSPSGPVIIRKNAGHSGRAQQTWSERPERKVESFEFDPNTVSIEDLMRLGFSLRQAESIDNYRRSGGRFRRKEDFAKSYVVADSVYERLQPYISIPLLDINAADSTAFDALPGIGPFYASRMVSYRNELGGYSYPGQLLDIYNFGQERFDGLKDLITVTPSGWPEYPLWTLPEEELEKHPYIGKEVAHGIVIFRENNAREALTVDALVEAGIMKKAAGEKLSRCRIADPLGTICISQPAP